MKAIGLDIGEYFIKVVETVQKTKNGKLYIQEIAHFPTPAGAISHGIVIDPEKLRKALQKIFTAYHFTTKNIIIGAPAELTFFKIFQVPATVPVNNKKKLFEYLKDDIQSELALPTSSLYFDYAPMNKRNTETGELYDVVFVAIKKEHLDPYLNIIQSLGKKLVAADSELFSEARTLYLFKNQEEVTYVLFNISSKSTTISFFSNNKLTYSRMINKGIEIIIKKISKFKNITEREAEYILNQTALKDFLREHQKTPIYIVVQQALNELTREIKRVISYYVSNIDNDTKKLTGILSGGGALLRGIDDILGENLGIPLYKNRTLSYLEPLNKNLDLDLVYDVSPLVSTAFGLSLWPYAKQLKKIVAKL